MFDMLYEIWCITDAFFAQFIVFDDSQDHNSLEDDDKTDDDNTGDAKMDDYNLYNGDLDNNVNQT
jgi:hypothetical protein